jgi:DNA topoisomerase I
MDLIIVESPTKAKTLSRFLGGEFAVEATYGHIRDLPEKTLGVDIEKEFEPEYVQTAKQKERTGQIKEAAKKADKIHLATDPDREGEAIAWHVEEILGDGKLHKRLDRIVFHEITQKAINEALGSPREVDAAMVNAQQARRVLDRLVGYKLSPILWRKVRKGLSAGRVQSVAVRLIVEREREIEAFVREEYWNLAAQLATAKNQKFTAMVMERDAQKIKIGNQEEADRVEQDLRMARFSIGEVQKREVKRTPPAPFTTSTLQQTAANRLGWSAKRTMQIAQSLYEEGYITYHRTDSTNLAAEAVGAARDYIGQEFGSEYALSQPRIYKTKSKVAQEAHEAIRPTDVAKSARSTELKIANRDELRLYELIWKRFVGCQMAEATGEEVKVTVEAKNSSIYKLEAKGLTMQFLGWMKLYEKKTESEEEEDGEVEAKLPELAMGEILELLEITKDQKFTQPPARYNDASLIKTLEEMGIGRPSTYAPILSTIQDRQYVEKIEKRFKPTALGSAVNDFLVTNFSEVVNYEFTARMEDELDSIANGEAKWKKVMSDFYQPFEKTLHKVQENAVRVKVEVETTGDKCPECHEGDVVVRIGKFGRFLACSRYPDCKYRANFVNKVGITCPKCGGDVIMRRTRSGKSFYGCSNYPNCDFASWTKPVVPAAAEKSGQERVK